MNEEIITDYNSFISELKSKIPTTKTINCKTSSMSLDYSTITITQEDIINAQKENFCPKIFENVKEDKCFNGVLFSDFASAGGKCCYLEIIVQGESDKFKLCRPLSKLERDNNLLAKELIKMYVESGQYSALISCDGFKEKYDSLTGQWTFISDSSSSSSQGSSSSSSSSSSSGSSSSSSSSSSSGSSSSPTHSSDSDSNSFIKLDNFNLSLLFLLCLLILI